jgi:hypothetical protein
VTVRGVWLALAAGSILGAGAAHADGVPTALVWLDGPHAIAEATAGALAAAKGVRPIDDRDAARLLVEGGPAARADAAIARAGEALLAQRCDAAGTEADQAYALVTGELAVADEAARLTRIANIRVACADQHGDEAGARAAVSLLAALAAGPPSAEAKALFERHPPDRPSRQPEVRLESDPAGATVYLDLKAVGQTPLTLPAERRPGALIDLELAGYRKVHRQAEQAGAVAVALAREDRLAALIDQVRGAAGDAPEQLVAELGRRVGATRVVVARRAPNGRVEARLLDVASGRWARPAQTFAESEAAGALVGYAQLIPTPAQAAKKTLAATVKAAPKPPVPAWKRWYTWVAGAVLVGAVIALVVADHVGSDQLTIHATH